MKLSISNIGWSEADDRVVYDRMKELGYIGLEIAPTRVFPTLPYADPEAAAEWKASLRAEYGLEICSMQSIWYGRNERIFGKREERQALEEYTYRAVDFAAAVGCKNLVFGCPKNRVFPEGGDEKDGKAFFENIGSYAWKRDCVISLEANPVIYQTNFLNTTSETLTYLREMDHPGLGLNLDTGTMVENRESIDILRGYENMIRHVHISEPWLAGLQKRNLHAKLAEFLRNMDYKGYISIEVKKQEDLTDLWQMMKYVKDIFG